ncbi:ATP-dependent zinc metalloprotease FtsH [Corynebacterium sp. CCM 8835]|uniref:ATP-dependent zinc metalloprotease FtsH n=1 Tax=Corynebacterium antarcticum TaxID=2800405 RepID=A0ABS1FIZ1_9CORY|nr:ATP-dependent zinc metalloprotease FtsH [Corynebacterium antarcticum]MCL0246480.1 ATP-dependent zinc metalloprotease FtsH [Corynebacterium antarcticum]MCX7492621.1 ATP-dependent zinc metalloprotease FtsH [Corynebacterium antarcticum]MCX7541204.1 ATP-dependent zinc metalloprotease FtsH [Corynebacterium antarcticum]
MDNKKLLRIGAIAAVILVALYVMTVLTDDTRAYRKVDTSVALAQLDEHNVAEAQIDDREQQIRLKLKEDITVEEQDGISEIIAEYPARTTPVIFDRVQAADAEKFTTKVTRESFLGSMFSVMLPMLIVFGLLIFFFSRMQGGGMGMLGIGGSRAKQLTKDMPTNTFEDVAGADEAVDELHEIKDFLQDPSRYEALGAKIPRGVLLYGPPGTGKTLLARAVAGEAGVPFYSISGSDFVEMFVGVGASRVRDLFKQARENSPCIIFVDEIDAVGRQRGSGMGGGHDEREQTLNQLLVEMDGFGDREGVILIAATNRPDILDPALLRPGRFDRQIPVTNPDLKGREMILKVHAKGKPLAPDADLNSLAKRTAGMSGADLANVLNEAALLTARIGGNVITADALEEATDRVVGGPRRSSKIISEHEKKVTAYHEGGHTLAAWAMKDIERVYKVTILARGRTGGHAMTAAEDDKGMYNRSELFARLVFSMGGRAAEELVFGQPTTGASSDIEQATKIARAMVTEYGMSPELGTVKYGEEQGDPFSGRGSGGSLDYSPTVAATIDQQTRYLLDKAHREAYAILRDNRETLDRLAGKLLEKETLRRPDLEALFTDITPREPLEVFTGEDTDYPRQFGHEPVKTPTELAIERGEEPPKKFSLLEMSKAARARRERQLAAQSGPGPDRTPQGSPETGGQSQQNRNPGPERPGDTGFGYGDATGSHAVDPVREAGDGGAAPTGRHALPPRGGNPVDTDTSTPAYGGTPPPPGWSAPGWPPRDGSRPNPYAAGAGRGTSERRAPEEHPGMASYGPGEPENGTDGVQTFAAPGDGELIGFRLPDHEQPEHAQEGDDRSDAPDDRDGNVSEAPSSSPTDVIDLGETTSEPPREDDDERRD